MTANLVAAQNEFDWETNPAAPGIFAGLAGFLCMIPVIWLVVAILIAVWVYKDAEKRDSSGALWLIIVIVTGIIGLIVWLVVRPPIGGEKKKSEEDKPERRCPSCGRVIPEDAKVCPYCGNKFEQ
ncbi:MAG: zinc ribbon domain-containing protein [Candidatus Thermoplasmatota archaeon]